MNLSKPWRQLCSSIIVQLGITLFFLPASIAKSLSFHGDGLYNESSQERCAETIRIAQKTLIKMCGNGANKLESRENPVPCESTNVTTVRGPGGVGETALINFLSSRGFLTNDKDNFDRVKHSPFRANNGRSKGFHGVNSGSCPNEPGLYLYGDPVASVFSLYRRNYAIRQYARLNQKHMGGPLPANASEYVRNGTDVWFQYKKHMTLWLRHCPNILAMTLTDMVDPGMLSLIAYHLNIPSSRIEGFNIAPRASPTTSDFDLPFYTKLYRDLQKVASRRRCQIGMPPKRGPRGMGPRPHGLSAANYIGE